MSCSLYTIIVLSIFLTTGFTQDLPPNYPFQTNSFKEKLKTYGIPSRLSTGFNIVRTPVSNKATPIHLKSDDLIQLAQVKEEWIFRYNTIFNPNNYKMVPREIIQAVEPSYLNGFHFSEDDSLLIQASKFQKLGLGLYHMENAPISALEYKRLASISFVLAAKRFIKAMEVTTVPFKSDLAVSAAQLYRWAAINMQSQQAKQLYFQEAIQCLTYGNQFLSEVPLNYYERLKTVIFQETTYLMKLI